ncbi:MAG: hypothetical protein F4Y86_08715 [Gammaproteobacteria bacterium]|nr:hypothetical protein [Gammaproteobacteria bacterium]
MPNPAAIDRLRVTDLHFDRRNPRLAEYDVGPDADDDEIIPILWEAMDVLELVQSIAASGFFSHEPLIVARERDEYVVIEGNRRLAAVKVLLDRTYANDRDWPIPRLSRRATADLEELPVIISDREESWRYLGFKHVNGPAKWSSFAKAEYIAEVHSSFEVPLSDVAKQIGDRHRTVERLYRGLMVLRQAEATGVYDRENRFRSRFAFSHLYTGLGYKGISSFLALRGVDAESATPVPEHAIDNLGELCLWLYGDKEKKERPVVERQNPHLRQLDAVLADREAIAALRASNDLSNAFEISRDPGAVFEEALLAGKRELQRARTYLTSYDGSRTLLDSAESVVELADDIFAEMDRKRRADRRRSRGRERT